MLIRALRQNDPKFLDKDYFDSTYLRSILYSRFKKPDCKISECGKIIEVFEHFNWEFDWDMVNK